MAMKSIQNHLTQRDNLIISLIAAISIAFTAMLSMNFPLEPGIAGAVSVYEKCPKRAVERGFSESICLHREFTNSAWGDSFEYFTMATGEDSFAPYSLRPFIPVAVGWLSKLTLAGEEHDDQDRLFTRISMVMVLLNLLTGILLVVLPIFFFRRLFLQSGSTVTLVVLTGVINLGFVQTAPFFMLDIASYLVFMMAAYFFFSRKIVALSLIACIGILVKEISIVLIIPLLALALFDLPKRVSNVFWIVLPIVAFVSLRLFMGEDPMSMQYGWDISKGQIKLDYLLGHIGGIPNILFFVVKVLAGVGGILTLCLYFHRTYGRENIFWTATILMFIAVLIANIILASRVPRVVGVVMPFFLFYTLFIINHKVMLGKNSV